MLDGLPESVTFRPRFNAAFYGALHVAAQYAGIEAPAIAPPISWQHGWIAPYRQTSPVIVTMSPLLHSYTHLVGREDEEMYLASHDIQAKAVGLPYAYALDVQQFDVRRIPGSLLIMPAHSSRLKLVSGQDAVDAFITTATRMAKEYEYVVVCLHAEDVRARTPLMSWCRNFTCIEGASVDDASALWRMRHLFSLFETVWTDSEGSHVPMALASGSRVAVFDGGPDQEYNSVAREPHDGFGSSREAKTKWFQENAPWLYRSPLDAALDVAWGDQQIGRRHTLKPTELIEILGWNRRPVMLRATAQLLHDRARRRFGIT